MTQIIIIGDSHTVALKKAAEQKLFVTPHTLHFIPTRNERYQPLLSEGNIPSLNPALIQAIHHLLENDTQTIAFATFGGNTHTSASLSPIRNQHYDFIVPGHEHLKKQDGAKIVPFNQIKMALQQRMSTKTLQPVLALKAAFPELPLIQLDSPPTNPSVEHILQHASKFAARIKERGISPAHFRLKYWLTHSKILRDTVQAAGIGFCPVPESTQDTEGFLREAYWNNDPTHANQNYGKLLLEQMIERATQELQ